MKEQILFVSKGGERCDEGFSYALELATSLAHDISVLIVYPQMAVTSFEDVMMTAAYAEAGDFRTVKGLMDEQTKAIRESSEERLGKMSLRCSERSIGFRKDEDSGDVHAAVKAYLRHRPHVDMILLSPSLSAEKKVFDMKKLIKQVAKPIVSISRPTAAEA